MPEREKLHLMARSQSTMCIFLSASIAKQVQEELLQEYPETTPVAVCYHLTWKDEQIFRGELKDLARIVKENNLTLTTMIVVGEASATVKVCHGSMHTSSSICTGNKSTINHP